MRTAAEASPSNTPSALSSEETEEEAEAEMDTRLSFARLLVVVAREEPPRVNVLLAVEGELVRAENENETCFTDKDDGAERALVVIAVIVVVVARMAIPS